jgi:hypothetical protein
MLSAVLGAGLAGCGGAVETQTAAPVITDLSQMEAIPGTWGVVVDLADVPSAFEAKGSVINEGACATKTYRLAGPDLIDRAVMRSMDIAFENVRPLPRMPAGGPSAEGLDGVVSVDVERLGAHAEWQVSDGFWGTMMPVGVARLSMSFDVRGAGGQRIESFTQEAARSQMAESIWGGCENVGNQIAGAITDATRETMQDAILEIKAHPMIQFFGALSESGK